MNKVDCFADLEVYKSGCVLQQAIFDISKCGYLSKLQFDEFRAKLTGIGRQADNTPTGVGG